MEGSLKVEASPRGLTLIAVHSNAAPEKEKLIGSIYQQNLCVFVPHKERVIKQVEEKRNRFWFDSRIVANFNELGEFDTARPGLGMFQQI